MARKGGTVLPPSPRLPSSLELRRTSPQGFLTKAKFLQFLALNYEKDFDIIAELKNPVAQPSS
ncbi:MAG: hypothetical protein WC454_09235 [Phycisphaerae bacterium]